ncbi:MAG TPA: hypothetical protein VGS03_16565, partial [Candidatus Polarisedimenticolia bacterium]|nr:hypothetical protein [Candidatus Polarisedimenticolia bacterium]
MLLALVPVALVALGGETAAQTCEGPDQTAPPSSFPGVYAFDGARGPALARGTGQFAFIAREAG